MQSTLKLVVPFVDELRPEDRRLVCLAEFIGVVCETVRLERVHADPSEYLKGRLRENNCCFVVNPQVFKAWLAMEEFPAELGSYLVSRFPFLFVHGLQSDPVTDSTVYRISGGHFTSVRPAPGSGLSYEIAAESKEICGAFSSLVFGPINVENDSILLANSKDSNARTLISIGGESFFASVSSCSTQIFFLATKDIVNLDTQVDDFRVADHFSRLVPPVMLFHHIFGETCWHSVRHHATLIIDDPLLRKRYGFMNFECVLKLMDVSGFHTSIAFIPYNYRRNSSDVARMFRENSNRYSLCFHGNDHTSAEFAEKDLKHLNSLLIVAMKRMVKHQEFSRIRCDKVMVFPQGKFSVSAMKALRANNFLAAVNTEHLPLGEKFSALRIVDMIQPAVMKYGGLPLFLRKYVDDLTSPDIAFNLLFGKPVLIVEHHAVFKDFKRIAELVSRINSIDSKIEWTNLQATVEDSMLQRFTSPDDCHVLAYSPSGRIENRSDIARHYSVVQKNSTHEPIEHLLLDGKPWPWTLVDGDHIHFSFDLGPQRFAEFAIVSRNDIGLAHPPKGFQYMLKTFMRRRLSEIRDNHLSTSPRLLSVAQSVKRLLLKQPA